MAVQISDGVPPAGKLLIRVACLRPYKPSIYFNKVGLIYHQMFIFLPGAHEVLLVIMEIDR